MDIVIDHLSKRFGEKEVIKDFSARIKEGSVTSLMAPSGWGKTTLLRIIAGLEKSDEGRIEGLENKKISMVFQEDRLCGNLSPISNIRFVCNGKVQEKQIYEELEKAGLKGEELVPARNLSGGMKKRVALVRALMVPFDVLILDEPFDGLDDKNKRKMINYVKEKSKGKTVILVTHEKKEAEAMGGEIIHGLYCIRSGMEPKQ